MSEIKDLFKTPLYAEYLKVNNDSIKKYITDYKKKNASVLKSNIGGWQSDNLEGKHLPLNDLFIDIEKHGNIFANKIGLKDNLTINNIWININYYKDYNINHRHSHCVLSGVFYVETPKDCGNIQFQSGDDDVRNYDWNENTIKERNIYTVPQYWMPALKNMLYIFPSWLSHNVLPNLNPKEERVSISFNLK